MSCICRYSRSFPLLPVIDSRSKFGMPPAEDTINICIIVLSIHMENETLVIGALVDAVMEVLEIGPELPE